MEDSLRHGTKFNEKGAREDVFEKVEEPFTFSRKQYPEEPTNISITFIHDIQRRLNGIQQNKIKLNISAQDLNKLKNKRKFNRRNRAFL